MKYVLFGMFAVFSAVAVAQNSPSRGALAMPVVPRTELYVGYSGVRFTPSLRGWTGTASHNLNRRFGLSAEVSGGYGDSYRFVTAPNLNGSVWNYNVLFGPAISLHRGHSRKKPDLGYNIFTHALAGLGVTRDLGTTLSESTIIHKSWASAIGGGYEVHFTKMIGAQVRADWLHQNSFNNMKNTFRSDMGIVFALPSTLP